MDNQKRIIELAYELQAISATGLLYSKQTFDIDRYHRIQEVAAELIALNSEEPYPLVKKVFEENDGYQTPEISTRLLFLMKRMRCCWLKIMMRNG